MPFKTRLKSFLLLCMDRCVGVLYIVLEAQSKLSGSVVSIVKIFLEIQWRVNPRVRTPNRLSGSPHGRMIRGGCREFIAGLKLNYVIVVGLDFS